jgi:glycosyltransferase involved in cell wall biosynthesis
MVACHCTEAHVSDDVTFIPYAQLPAYAWGNPQIVVASRWFAALAETTAKRILWLQDAWFAAPPDDLWPRLDAVVVSSPWHQSYVAQRTNPAVSSKTQVIPLGIRKQHFRAQVGVRQPHQLIYSSNPDRGLETLIAAWPQIVTRVPDVNLVITYGWEGLRTWSTDAAWLAQQEANQQRMTAWAAANNAVFTGRLRKADLYQVMSESALCAYPNTFQETFCLTALECQAAGTPLVTSALGALTTTVNTACNVLLQGNPGSPAYRDVFAAQVGDLLLDDARRQDYSAQCQDYVMNAPCDWADIAQSWLTAVWR